MSSIMHNGIKKRKPKYMWRDSYRLWRIGKSRWIIRNQWHEFTNTGTFLIEIGINRYRDRTEWILTIAGFQLVVFT